MSLHLQRWSWRCLRCSNLSGSAFHGVDKQCPIHYQIITLQSYCYCSVMFQKILKELKGVLFITDSYKRCFMFVIAPTFFNARLTERYWPTTTTTLKTNQGELKEFKVKTPLVVEKCSALRDKLQPDSSLVVNLDACILELVVSFLQFRKMIRDQFPGDDLVNTLTWKRYWTCISLCCLD